MSLSRFDRRSILESSLLVRAVVRATGMVASIGHGTLTWIRQTNERLIRGLRERRRSSNPPIEELQTITDDSVTVRFVSRVVDAPAVAWDHSRIKQWVDALLSFPLAVRMRLAGEVVLTAVVTHVIVMAALGVAVHTLGWTMRVLLALLAIALMLRSEAFAAAWRERVS
jgi:hypothetical protein